MGLYINYLITGFFFLVIGIPILLSLFNNKYNLDWNYDKIPNNSLDGLGK